jgi:hypothetical protein
VFFPLCSVKSTVQIFILSLYFSYCFVKKSLSFNSTVLSNYCSLIFQYSDPVQYVPCIVRMPKAASSSDAAPGILDLALSTMLENTAPRILHFAAYALNLALCQQCPVGGEIKIKLEYFNKKTMDTVELEKCLFLNFSQGRHRRSE